MYLTPVRLRATHIHTNTHTHTWTAHLQLGSTGHSGTPNYYRAIHDSKEVLKISSFISSAILASRQDLVKVRRHEWVQKWTLKCNPQNGCTMDIYKCSCCYECCSFSGAGELSMLWAPLCAWAWGNHPGVPGQFSTLLRVWGRDGALRETGGRNHWTTSITIPQCCHTAVNRSVPSCILSTPTSRGRIHTSKSIHTYMYVVYKYVFSYIESLHSVCHVF